MFKFNRQLDELGRVVVPKEMRTALHINEGDRLSITANGDKIILEKLPSDSMLNNLIMQAESLLSDVVNYFPDYALEGKLKSDLKEHLSNSIKVLKTYKEL